MRGILRGGILVKPFARDIASRLQFGLSAKYWNELSQSGNFDDGDDSFDNVEVYINYYLDDEHRFGLGLTYFDGDNPTDGLLDQRYTQFGIVVKTGD